MSRFTVTAYFTQGKAAAMVQGFDNATSARCELVLQAHKAALVTVQGPEGGLLAYCEGGKAPVYLSGEFRKAPGAITRENEGRIVAATNAAAKAPRPGSGPWLFGKASAYI